ncbi:unnamed protein product (macronuclear) [Paramecium tetraurelia]|uniref:Generative cell specific-1/HAP2 domain-containing protein n=1 Tax=Paramecium tetraurelia TaxID=5888 RepID=A0C2L6_PARTE|nr:uncharacterized protein GSPATT00034511001 [Paramecium tetraurelia]CAK65033.1 unnamed protein product [Paramecium tetraurelia]|eukprot:XP_001432430.1 hypothetical protein (macronuclear) [Paramecium tetraurelia strain d4-2]
MSVFLLTLLRLTSQEPLTTSQIKVCDSNKNADCSENMLISLTIENSFSTSTEQIQINSTILNNQTVQLSTPFTLTITKTPVYAYYPLKYFQNYNSQPYELQIPSAVNPCDDNWTSNSPTCGFQYSSTNKVQDSQGFCCSCGSSEYSGQNDQSVRINICKNASVATMAFCLRYSPLWYSSYNISKFVIHYNITISIKYSNDEVEQYTLGSEVKEVKGESSIAKIISDYIPSNQPPSLESFMLMKPSSPTSHNRVQAGSAAYMFVPKEFLGQGECNKIGVSYTSFKNERNSCKKLIRSCLQNQLEDLYQNDIAQLNNNSQPTYLIQKYGEFKQININNDQYLQFSIDQQMFTTITLEINTTGRISYIGNKQESVKGQIDLVEIHNFSIASGSGLLYAQITNTGGSLSEFKSFFNCSTNTITINSTELEPLQSIIIQQDINVSIDIKKSTSCNFSLLSNEGALLDWKIVYLNQFDNNTNQSNNYNQTITSEGKVCEIKCSQFIDISCYLQNNCEKDAITFFTVLGGILLTFSFCCLYVGQKRNSCCFWSKNKRMSIIPPLESVLYQQNSQMKRRIGGSESSYEQISQLQISILSANLNKIMYLNLALGTDPISNHLQSDASFEVLATYQNKDLVELSIKRRSPFVRIFKEIYGLQDADRNVKKYLEGKRESIYLFSNLLTEFPLFSIY